MNKNEIMLLGDVKEFFHVESSLFMTNNSQGYKAVQKDNGRSIILWVLRKHFDLINDQDDVSAFLSRLEKIKSFTNAFSDIINFSIDKNGVGYCTMGISSYMPILHGKLNYKESIRRFESILKYVRKMHQEEIVWGDLCGESFGIDREGKIRPLSLLGAYPTKNAFSLSGKDYVMPTEEEKPSFRSDVYRLGILAYKLFSFDKDAFPFDEEGNYIPTSSKNLIVDKYIDDIIVKCLKEKPEDRFENALEVYNFFKNKEETKKSNVVGALVPSDKELHGLIEKDIKSNEGFFQKYKNISLFCLITFVLSALFFFVVSLFSQKEKPKVVESSQVYTQEELQDNLEELEKKLQGLYDKEDPIIYGVIVKMASQSIYPEERKLVEKYIAKRFHNYKYDYTKNAILRFGNSILGNNIPKFYSELLTSLDIDYPKEKRISYFKFLSKDEKNRPLIVDFALSCALDSKDEKPYRDVFIKFLDEKFLEDIDRRDFYTLAIAEPLSWTNYSSVLDEKLNEISDENLIWLLPVFVHNKDVHLNKLIDIIVSKNLLNKLQSQVLSFISKLNPPEDVRNTILKMSVGQIQRDDIKKLISWENPNKIELYNTLILMLSNDSSLRREIFDSLSVLPIKSEALDSYVKFVMNEEYDYRHNLSLFVPYLYNPSGFGDQEIYDALRKSLVKLEDEDKQNILTNMLKSCDYKIKKIILENFYDTIGVGNLINFLSSEDKELKKLSILNLKKFDIQDVFISNSIIEKYEEETDDELLDLYRNSFWFIRTRE